MKLAEAQELAIAVAALFEPACERVVIAGSIRRQQDEVTDIDLVGLLPSHEAPRIAAARLDGLVARLLQAKTLLPHPKHPKMGPKQKRFLVPSTCWIRTCTDGASVGTTEHFGGVSVDFCTADESNMGYRLALSTGDADWNHLLVTLRSQGGLKPDTVTLAEGYVYQSGNRVCVPTEKAFFDVLGIPFVAPFERTQSKAQDLLTEIRHYERQKGAA